MTCSVLIAQWESPDPLAQAQLLVDALKDAEYEFGAIRADRKVREPHWWESRDNLLYLRNVGYENPVCVVGYTERHVILRAKFPRLTAVRQSRVSLLRWRSYEVTDHEREERWHRLVAEVASRAGLNPLAAKFEWGLDP